MQFDYNDLSPLRLPQSLQETSLVSIWPPAYVLRSSPRAKRITVQISPKRGLEIVVPLRARRVSEFKILDILNEHRGWVEKHLKLWSKTQKDKQHEALLPQKIVFPAFQQNIQIEYQHNDSSQLRLKLIQKKHEDLTTLHNQKQGEHQEYTQTIMAHPVHNSVMNTLILSGATHDTEKLLLALRKFLSQQAHHYLIPMLNDLSLSSGLAYTSATIRRQTSLWGSCTALKKISLNAKLLFLPDELVRYVLLHELCHTQHMNHSIHFWNLLKKFDPFCLMHRRSLRKAAIHLPRWIEDTF